MTVAFQIYDAASKAFDFLTEIRCFLSLPVCDWALGGHCESSEYVLAETCLIAHEVPQTVKFLDEGSIPHRGLL